MKAIAQDGYGPPDSLELREIDKPSIDEKGVLIRVRSAAVNPYDWRMMRGEPRALRRFFRRKLKDWVPGADVAGHVEEVGSKVTQFRPGDEVFGVCNGAFAEFTASTEHRLIRKPAAITWDHAASIPIAGCTALQAVRDHGRVRPGQNVLVNGAAGGVGTFAVQIAKALGTKVTGVCSTRNLDLVLSIGADHVVDYTVDDVVASGRQYDLIVQVAGNRTVKDLRRVLAPNGSVVVVGGGVGHEEDGDEAMGEVLALMIRGMILSRFVRQRTSMFMGRIRRNDLLFIAGLIQAGTLRPVIDRTYPLASAADAIRHLETGHARGKVIVSVP
jgi:NADPH:quinone reductase-like Zn-dependent oxidoreductase